MTQICLLFNGCLTRQCIAILTLCLTLLEEHWQHGPRGLRTTVPNLTTFLAYAHMQRAAPQDVLEELIAMCSLLLQACSGCLQTAHRLIDILYKELSTCSINSCAAAATSHAALLIIVGVCGSLLGAWSIAIVTFIAEFAALAAKVHSAPVRISHSCLCCCYSTGAEMPIPVYRACA